jgi:hypothetical protein
VKLIVDGAAGTVTVDDAENLNALSVELRACPPGAPGELPGALGRIEGDHAFLEIKALRALVPLPHSCSWDERFDQAMEYAGKHGWTDAQGHVRAHVTRPQDAPAAAEAPTVTTSRESS